MLKLIIVDDEKITRDGLEQYIPWSKFGITAVHTARNGLAALELAKQIRPDIVITDVRMPKMDGIQFAMQLRELMPECKIIFLSGYSDKEYLKSAIHLKAINYIEKPINFEEITQVVSNTAALCEEEIKKKTETLPFQRQEIAIELIKENPNIAELKKKFSDPVFEKEQKYSFTAACILLNWKPVAESEQSGHIRRSISCMFCDRTAWNPEQQLVSGFIGNDKIALVIAGPTGCQTEFQSIMDKVLTRLTELSMGYYSASIGVGSTGKGLDNVPVSFREASNSVLKQFYHGVNRIYTSCRTQQANYVFDPKTAASFREHLKTEDESTALEIFETLTRDIQAAEDLNIDYIKNIYFNLLLIVFEAARAQGLIESAVKNEKRYTWQEIDGFKTLAELSGYVRSHIKLVFNRMDGKEVISRKAYEVMRYIREHYADKELSIQAIANHSYLSLTYLCSFFKKATGKTVNEYITEVRIEKAKELLKDSRTKLYEIALSIGFTDTNYFSALFKRCVGCNPSEYRERLYL